MFVFLFLREKAKCHFIYYAMRGIITVVLFERVATGASLQIGDDLRANGDLLLILRSAPTTKEGSPKRVHPHLSNLPLGWVVPSVRVGVHGRAVYTPISDGHIIGCT